MKRAGYVCMRTPPKPLDRFKPNFANVPIDRSGRFISTFHSALGVGS